uniref:Uncharacterized protein AlNc14C78G5162 n=1 Tax=Albugo laibachii Nc14 TaxID=890382 RepID=F0WEW4_9STRA|nr:conserved hypothetical protein [Albugo laibachii Nc14]|eukprot:CCA19746.1 conserved hypothetical protein [Albugo laibachii Nc14]
MTRKRFNLPENYFQCPPLSAQEQDFLITKAKNSARSLVETLQSASGPIEWMPAGSHRNIQLFRGRERERPSILEPQDKHNEVQYVCGATRVKATHEEIARFFDTSTTSKMRTFARLYNEDVLDTVVLHTLVCPTVENQMHQVTVKWTAVEIPSPFIRNRDFCTLECQDVFQDQKGQRGWVRSIHSIQLDCCPDMRHKLGYIRGSMYNTGYVFMESEEKGYLDLVHCVQVSLKGNLRLPRPIYFLACRRRVLLIAHFTKHLQQKRLSQLRLLGDLDLVAKNERTQCDICQIRFHLFLRKMRCRACGEVVCADCSQSFTFVHGGDLSTTSRSDKQCKLVKLRICLLCTNETDQRALNSSATATARSVMDEKETFVRKINSKFWHPMRRADSGYLRPSIQVEDPRAIQSAEGEIDFPGTDAYPTQIRTEMKDELHRTSSYARGSERKSSIHLKASKSHAHGATLTSFALKHHEKTLRKDERDVITTLVSQINPQNSANPFQFEVLPEADDEWDLQMSYGVDEEHDVQRTLSKWKNPLLELDDLKNSHVALARGPNLADSSIHKITSNFMSLRSTGQGEEDEKALSEFMVDHHRISLASAVRPKPGHLYKSHDRSITHREDDEESIATVNIDYGCSDPEDGPIFHESSNLARLSECSTRSDLKAGPELTLHI